MRFIAKTTAVFVGAALALMSGQALARGGHGGGGGHVGGGHFGGGHVSAAPHVSSPSYAPHYSAPHVSSAPHYSGGGAHYSAPHYSGGGAYHGGAHYSAPHYSSYGAHGYVGSPMYRGGVGVHGYIGGGRGAYVVGGRVPAFRGGPHGRVWWGPHYGWRVPVYWGGYWHPYASYWGVNYWVTDWIMLDYLAAEEARMMAYNPRVVAVPVESPPIATDVREELRAQITETMAMPVPPASSAPPSDGSTLVVTDPRVASALGAPHHIFIVSKPVTATDATTGAACPLTAADLVRTSSPVPSGQSAVNVHVVGAKHGSCALGGTVTLPIADLVVFEQSLLERIAKGTAAANAVQPDPASDTQPGAPPVAPMQPGAATAPSAIAPQMTAPPTTTAPPSTITTTTSIPGALSI